MKTAANCTQACTRQSEPGCTGDGNSKALLISARACARANGLQDARDLYHPPAPLPTYDQPTGLEMPPRRVQTRGSTCRRMNTDTQKNIQPKKTAFTHMHPRLDRKQTHAITRCTHQATDRCLSPNCSTSTSSGDGRVKELPKKGSSPLFLGQLGHTL